MVRRLSWLCPTADHRERFLDMQERVRTARLVTIICGVALMFIFSARGGWPIVAFGTSMLLVVLLGGMHLDRRARPELWVFFTTVLNIQLLLTVAAVLTGGPRTPLPCLLAGPVLMVGARFSNRGLIVGAPISAILVLVSTVGVDPTFAARHVEAVAVPLLLVLITAAYVSPMVTSDLRHRADSTLDPLTGLLNRRSLTMRLEEVSEQAAVNSQPVSVVALDVDRFKAINDEHGHEAGDVALREIADALRGELRTFELLYRVGGDEFILLLPGASLDDATQLAEKLREAVARAQPIGETVTCSCGVATALGRTDAKALMRRADAALYRAKHRGRNRVEADEHFGAAAAA
jgi:diguanylate cyclase (GGDEF)-like protein